MKDWSATRRAAAALTRLNQVMAGTQLTDAELDSLANEADALTARFEGGAPRAKLDDMMTRPHLARLYRGEHAPLQLEIGDAIEFDPFSIAGGDLHPASMGLVFRKTSDTTVEATGVIDPMFSGPPERIHGGVQALIADELMGAVNRMLGRQAFTARLTVNYRGPAPIGHEVTFRAWLHDVDGRKVTVLAEGHGPDGLFMDADGLFIARRENTDPLTGQPLG